MPPGWPCRRPPRWTKVGSERWCHPVPGACDHGKTIQSDRGWCACEMPRSRSPTVVRAVRVLVPGEGKASWVAHKAADRKLRASGNRLRLVQTGLVQTGQVQIGQVQPSRVPVSRALPPSIPSIQGAIPRPNRAARTPGALATRLRRRSQGRARRPGPATRTSLVRQRLATDPGAGQVADPGAGQIADPGRARRTSWAHRARAYTVRCGRFAPSAYSSWLSVP
jgi:hypothetical protein